MLILNDLHMIMNNLRWYNNQKLKVSIFPSYLNSCQSSCFYHHILWRLATFSSNTITRQIWGIWWPSNLIQIGLKSSINQPVWPWNLINDLEKQKGTSSILHQTLCIISNPLLYSNWSYSPEILNSGKNWRLFCPAWPWNLMDDLEK